MNENNKKYQVFNHMMFVEMTFICMQTLSSQKIFALAKVLVGGVHGKNTYSNKSYLSKLFCNHSNWKQSLKTFLLHLDVNDSYMFKSKNFLCRLSLLFNVKMKLNIS